MFRALKSHTLLKYSKVIRSPYRTFKLEPENSDKFESIQIPVPWGVVAAKWWGPTKERPIIGMHGWQDNAGTFDKLAPLIENRGFLCIDFPGHGHSSRYPNGMIYSALDNVVLLIRIMRYFAWDKLSIIGHSMGGITSFLFASYYPKLVDFMVLIDALKPMSLLPGGMIARTPNKIDKFLKYDALIQAGEEPPAYALEELVKKLHEGSNKSVAIDKCEYLLRRMVRKSKKDVNKYYITRDPRIKVGSIVGMIREDIIEHCKNVTCPTLVIKAERSTYFEDPKYFYEVLQHMQQVNNDCVYHRVDGTHHVHLNNPEKVADLINTFIKTHDKFDRMQGGLRNK